MREWISGKVGHAWRAWAALVLQGKDDDKLRKFVKQMVRQWTSGKLAMAFRPWAADVQRYREQQDKQRKFVTQMMRQLRSGKFELAWRQWNFVAKHQARITKIASRWNNRRVLAGFKSWTLFAIAARGQQDKQRKFVERMVRQWLATKLALAWRPWLNLVKSGTSNDRQRHQHRAFRHAASQWRRGTVGAAFARLCEHARDISRSTSTAALRKALAELAALRAERAAQTGVASAEQEAELARHRQLLQESAALASRQQAELEDQQAELEELRRFRDGYFQDELLGKQEVCAATAAAAAAAATLACACAMFALDTRLRQWALFFCAVSLSRPPAAQGTRPGRVLCCCALVAPQPRLLTATAANRYRSRAVRAWPAALLQGVRARTRQPAVAPPVVPFPHDLLHDAAAAPVRRAGARALADQRLDEAVAAVAHPEAQPRHPPPLLVMLSSYSVLLF